MKMSPNIRIEKDTNIQCPCGYTISNFPAKTNRETDTVITGTLYYDKLVNVSSLYCQDCIHFKKEFTKKISSMVITEGIFCKKRQLELIKDLLK